MYSKTVLSALLVALSIASPIKKRRGYVVKETHPLPPNWTLRDEAPQDLMMQLQIALKQSNFAELERQLYDVSDPDSDNYGKHLSPEDVHELIKPHDASLDSVLTWLEAHDIAREDVNYSPAKDWIFVEVPVSTANYMLDTQYNVYTHDVSKYAVARVEGYSLPLELHAHIDTIQPTTYFSGFKQLGSNVVPFTEEELVSLNLAQEQQRLNALDTADEVSFYCNTSTSVACLRQLYETVNYTAQSQSNKLGITGYLGEVANRKDLQTFLAAERPEAVGTTFTEYLVNNGTNVQTNSEFNSSGTLEAGLDIQFGTGITYPTSVVFWSTGGSPPSTLEINTSEPYLEWLQFVLAQSSDKVPQTISTSYGDDENTVPEYYAVRTCQLFAQLGARGVTLFFSSGDNGVGPGSVDTCTTFVPAYPASCPYVTTVGGTVNIPNERMVTRFSSGAGFSNYFGMPDYQKSAVSGYLQNVNQSLIQSYQSQNLYNASGRAYPDISCQGDRFPVFVPGTYFPRDQNTSGFGLIGGTSASSPTCASVFSQVNDYLISKGKSPLGFMNPALYSKLSSGFHDITVGDTSNCNTTGFPAGPGFDLASGFGTPRFEKIIALLDA